VKGKQILLFIMVAPKFLRVGVSFRGVVFDRAHRVTVFDALAKIECDQVARLNALGDLDFLAVVIPEGYFCKMDVSASDQRGKDLTAAKHQRIVGDAGRGALGRDAQNDGRIHSGEQRRVGVGKIHLHAHGARVLLQRIGMSRDSTLELATGVLGYSNCGGVAVLDQRRNVLWHVCIDAQWMQRCQLENGSATAGVVTCGINAPWSTYRAVIIPSVSALMVS
jgi:hypothetical protein